MTEKRYDLAKMLEEIREDDKIGEQKLKHIISQKEILSEVAKSRQKFIDSTKQK